MDRETKITYLTISVLIVLLGGLAFYLQNDDTPPAPVDKQVVTAPIKKPVTTTPTTPVTQGTTTASTTPTMDTTKITHATITTNMGVIEIELSSATPNTVKNFITLAQSKFYDGVRFHRVIKNFMIQTGDPLSKDTANQSAWGTGGPGYKFNDELTGKEQYLLGTVAMANSGPNTNGSQFFIVTANPGYPLPPNYTVFGKVAKGIDVALKIQDVKTGTADRPLEDVLIEKVEVAQ
jgi:peptidylprolyl isomerase